MLANDWLVCLTNFEKLVCMGLCRAVVDDRKWNERSVAAMDTVLDASFLPFASSSRARIKNEAADGAQTKKP
jgi:hypothetical protein